MSDEPAPVDSEPPVEEPVVDAEVLVEKVVVVVVARSLEEDPVVDVGVPVADPVAVRSPEEEAG